jgi:oligopeptide transport system permease protein
MLTYTLRRVLWLVPVILAASVVTFFVMHLAPGNPWNRGVRPLPDALVASLNERFGLDRPLWEQYLLWLGNLLRGDLGTTFDVGEAFTVWNVLAFFGPTSLHLGAMAFGLAVLVGVPIGAVAALRHRTIVDYAASGVALLGMAAPAFLLGTFLQLVLGEKPYVADSGPLPSRGWETPAHWVLPTVALAGLPMAQVARFTRASLLEVMSEDYVRTAASKGLTERRIVSIHMFRNALIPIVTILGPLLAMLITGAIVVEAVFGIPGLGGLYIGSIYERDYGVVMGMSLIFATAVAVTNLLVDLLYGYIDPRIGRAEAKR